MGMLKYIGAAFGWMIKWAVLPMTKLRGSSGARKWLRWTAHVLLVGAILVGLAYLNYALELEKVLRTPWSLLRQVWLPLLFAMMYGVAMLAWRLWRTTTAEGDPSPFPEIDKQWRSAVESLERVGVDLKENPVYLMLGRPHGSSQRFYHAAHLPLALPPTPSEPGALFRVSAARDAIYVNCDELSTLSLWCTALEKQRRDHLKPNQPHVVAQPGSSASSVESGAIDLEQISPELFGGGGGGTAVATAPALQTSAATQTLDVLEQQVAMLAEAEETVVSRQQATVMQPAVAPAAPPLESSQIEECLAKLHHLCELIATERGAYCPINGVVLLTPFSATENESDANHAGALLQRDLQTVNDALQVHTPITAVICDLQEARGCRELLERFPEEQRQRRFGLRFPKLAACDSPSLPALLDQGAQWICDRLAPPLVYRLFRTGADQAADQYEVKRNIELYHFLRELRDRRPCLERVLRRGLTTERGSLGYFNGCFLSATGEDAVREQGFAASLFPQLQEIQNRLQWSPEAIQKDAAYRRWTLAGYVSIVAVTCMVVALAVWL